MQKHHNILIRVGVLLAASLVLAAAQPLPPEVARLPVTRGNLVRDYARITFEWPQPVYFRADAKGRELTISFDRNADPDFSQMLTSLYPYVTSARRSGKTVTLTLDKPYKIRTFISDNVSGIDLLHIDRAARLALKQEKPEKPPAPEAAKRTPPPKILQAKKRSVADAGRLFAELSPAAGEEKPPAAEAAISIPEAKPAEKKEPAPPEVAAPAPEPKPAETAAPVEPAKPAEPPPAVAEAKPEETPPAATDAAPAPVAKTGDSVAVPPPAQSALEPTPAPVPVPNPSGIKVTLSAEEDNAALRFAFTERVAAAVFERAGYLWIAFDKPLQLDLSDFSVLPKTVIETPQLVPNLPVTVLRIPMDNHVHASVSEEQGKFEWAVLLAPKTRPLANGLKITINTEPPVPPHVLIPALEVGQLLTIKDPQLGDDLVVIPLYNAGEGIPARREFVEFTLPETAQGVVVAKKAEGVEVTEMRNGLRVSLPSGAVLSSNLPEASKQSFSGMKQNVATLFPYEKWKLDETTDRRKKMRELFHIIVESKDIRDANEARLRMAQIYLSDGMAVEALSYLDGIQRTTPVYFRSAKLAALRGAANFLAYRFSEAARDFASSELDGNKEINYWRSMLSDLLGAPGESYNYMDMNDDYIDKYPPLFRQRLAIVAADRSIDAKEYNVALKIFDVLYRDNMLDSIDTYVNYLLAKISADTGQDEEATLMWDKLADDYKHPFVQARAEFSRIVWAIDHGTIDKDQVIDRLERLRLGWHGDGLELKVLMMLGDLYYDKKDYINAMRVWDGAVTTFTNTAAAVNMFHKMEDTFTAMFNEGAAEKLSPLEALALYYQYRNFAPPGALGNDMIDRLADRLIGVDLLSQAAALLDHQMHFQSEKEQRSRIGVKLATVHLLNHEPKRALAALEDSVYGENPVLLRLQRNRLTAEAMSELGQSDRALQILGQDDSLEAEQIRLNVYWHEKDWPRVISSVETLLKARKDTTAPVTVAESESLMKLALAYVFENNTAQLQYLRDYFAPLMAGNPNKQIFDFITATDIPLTPTSFDDIIQRLSDTRSFIDNYKARIETATLDENKTKETAPADKPPAEEKPAEKPAAKP